MPAISVYQTNSFGRLFSSPVQFFLVFFIFDWYCFGCFNIWKRSSYENVPENTSTQYKRLAPRTIAVVDDVISFRVFLFLFFNFSWFIWFSWRNKIKKNCQNVRETSGSHWRYSNDFGSPNDAFRQLRSVQ